MASPLQTGKQSVNLAGGVRVSRIRRDPPPVAAKVSDVNQEERETRMVMFGVALFAVALVFILFGFASFYGWSPSEYTIHLKG